jgi:hypothetical protein
MVPRYWEPIETAPRKGNFDVWAKHWLPNDDQFIWRRFPDCYMHLVLDSLDRCELKGVPREWCATHWMELPSPPCAVEDRPPYRIWVRENRHWAKASGEYTIRSDIRMD